MLKDPTMHQLTHSHEWELIPYFKTPPIVDFKQMATAQQQDPDILKLKTSSSSLTLKACPIPMSDGKIICDMSTGVPRPMVPSSYRRQVFDSLHSLSHPGVRATQ